MNPVTAAMHPTPQSFGELLAYLSTTVVAIGVLWRLIIRPVWKVWKRFQVKLHAALDLVDRELTHNGGSSLKDAMHRVDRNVAELDAEVLNLKTQSDERGLAIEALAQVMDEIVDRKQEDHERIWRSIMELGGTDPRKR